MAIPKIGIKLAERQRYGRCQRAPWPRSLANRRIANALRALVGKPCLHTEAIARRHARFPDSMGNGGTHMLQKALSISVLCQESLRDICPLFVMHCRAAWYLGAATEPSLADHGGKRRAYCYYTDGAEIDRPLTSVLASYDAA